MTKPFNDQQDFEQFTRKKNSLFPVKACLCEHTLTRILNSYAEYMHKNTFLIASDFCRLKLKIFSLEIIKFLIKFNFLVKSHSRLYNIERLILMMSYNRGSNRSYF